MKKFLQYILQRIFGFSAYLFLFSLFKIKTLKSDKKENDFFFFLNLIPEDAVILDIGANIGIMTVHLAKKAVRGTIHAFEPVPQNVKTLNKIVSFFKLKNVLIYETALGDENKEMQMVLPVVDSVKMQGLSHIVHSSITEFNEGEKFTVKIQPMDDVLNNVKKIDAIKIDVENFEYYALKGGERLIEKYKPLIYAELWDNENRKKCFQFFEHNNYSVNIVEEGKLEKFEPTKHRKQNFICTPKNSE